MRCKLFLFFFLTSVVLHAQFDKVKIDSITGLEVQAVKITQDSLNNLLLVAMKSAQEMGYKKGEAEANVKLGVNSYYTGDFESNAEYMLQAIQIYEEIKDDGAAAKAYGQLGYQNRRRDLQMANRLMQKGIRLAEANEIEVELPALYNNYGVIKDMEGKKDSSVYYSLKGLEMVRKLKDSIGLGYSLANLGNSYIGMDDYKTARPYFDESLYIRKLIDDSIGLGESYVQQGELDQRDGDLRKALYNYRLSNRYSEKKKYLRLSSYSYFMMSQVFKQLNNADSALHYFEKHLFIKDSIESQGVLEKLASLRVEFDTEKKENEILKQRTLLAEKDLEVKQRNSLIYGSLAFAVVLGLIGYLLYHRQKLKNKQIKKEAELNAALSKIETQNKLQEQRLRISRDLHDNIGSQLTFVTSSVDNLKYGLKDSDQMVSKKLGHISEFTTQTIYELRDTIWAMNKTEISVEDLQARIANFIDKAGAARNEITFDFKLAKTISKSKIFSSIVGMNLYRIMQEAVNNSLKYAATDRVDVFLGKEHDRYVLQISDHGKGFEIAQIEMGNGLNNMKKRARDIDAEIAIISKVGEGTDITVRWG